MHLWPVVISQKCRILILPKNWLLWNTAPLSGLNLYWGWDPSYTGVVEADRKVMCSQSVITFKSYKVVHDHLDILDEVEGRRDDERGAHNLYPTRGSKGPVRHGRTVSCSSSSLGTAPGGILKAIPISSHEISIPSEVTVSFQGVPRKWIPGNCGSSSCCSPGRFHRVGIWRWSVCANYTACPCM